MDWYLTVIRKYAEFEGRARRKEYWMFVLFNIIITFVLAIVDVMMGLGGPSLGLLSGLYTLVVLIPGLAVGVRRLHDTGRSGWWLLVAFVPLLGAIALIVFTVQDSEPGPNEYGPNPKEVAVIA